MDIGVISNRYATAFLGLTIESGRGAQVYEQAQTLLSDNVPQKLEPDIEKLTALLVKNGRVPYLKYILESFCRKYRKWAGIEKVTLEVASPSDELDLKIKKLLSDKYGESIVLDQKVNPDLIGGFVLMIDDMMVDTSIKKKLDTIHRSLDKMNKRLV